MLFSAAVTSTIIQVHKGLEEASVACGAGFMATFRRILVPMMRPGVMAGWIILVTIFMREFSATLFLYSPGSEPLGPLLYFLYLDGMRGRVAAIGLVISVISIILIAVAQRLFALGQVSKNPCSGRVARAQFKSWAQGGSLLRYTPATNTKRVWRSCGKTDFNSRLR